MDNQFLDLLSKSFLNQTTLNIREEKWTFLNQEFTVPVKSTVEISQNFVAFSEYMNFIYSDSFQRSHEKNLMHSTFVVVFTIFNVKRAWISVSG